jgi:hypothetical protein
MIADHMDLLAGILLGCIWTSCLFAVFIARHLP